MKEREDEWKEEGGEQSSQSLLMNRRKETRTEGSQHFLLTLKHVHTHGKTHTLSNGALIVFSSAELSQKLLLCCYFIVIVTIQ